MGAVTFRNKSMAHAYAYLNDTERHASKKGTIEAQKGLLLPINLTMKAIILLILEEEQILFNSCGKAKAHKRVHRNVVDDEKRNGTS